MNNRNRVYLACLYASAFLAFDRSSSLSLAGRVTEPCFNRLEFLILRSNDRLNGKNPNFCGLFYFFCESLINTLEPVAAAIAHSRTPRAEGCAGRKTR